MSGKTTYLSTSNFTEQAIIDSSGVECSLNNSYFRKGDSLKHEDIREILDICKKYHKLNINTLVIENEQVLTIWIEKKPKKTSIQNVEFDSQKPQSQRETPANNQPLPTKTITRRYRSQVYEETVIDWSAIHQSNQQNKSPRKYRGQYID